MNRRDVEALLWKWFDAESTARAFREGNTPDWEAEGTKEAEGSAERALAAVLKVVEPPQLTTAPPQQQYSDDNDFP